MLLHSGLMRIYHSSKTSREKFRSFLEGLAKLLEHRRFLFSLLYKGGEFAYGVSADDEAMPIFTSKFYSEFGDFQLTDDTLGIVGFDASRSVVMNLGLANSWYFPFAESNDQDDVDFMNKVFRSFDTLNPSTDRIGFFLALEPFEPKGAGFLLSTWWKMMQFRIRLFLTSYRHWFDTRAEKGWKKQGFHFLDEKMKEELFRTRAFLVIESESPKNAKRIAEAFFHNFALFKNLPLNEFEKTIFPLHDGSTIESILKQVRTELIFTPDELSRLYHFPKDPTQETALLKIGAKKLALPTGMPLLPYTIKKGQVSIIAHDPTLAIFAESDYRSLKVPIGIYDEDRLRHMYVVGKTGVGKSKFLLSQMIDDIEYGKGIAVIDPHGDLIEEIMMHIPDGRKDDVIIFDPTDEAYPFCFNPLSMKPGESKQVLAKGFIDIFKKFFGANWNSKLEHVLRMLFLGLLDLPGATMFDMIRAITNKDFRYLMIEHVQDDVVRNFWTNEFASWSQQFNSEAIMPILNKVGQLLSIDMVKNIFISSENKLDLRRIMDTGKILLIKLPKGRLQEEIMGFLGAMLVTKMYQTAMGRSGTEKNTRTPFFLYIDEFQNFATETFSEILSEARKYGLGLIVAHQFLHQMSTTLSHALFGNVGTLVSFRISAEDARVMMSHFDPYVGSYDLANLGIREAYAKMLVKGQVRDPLSIKTRSVPDIRIDPQYIESLYQISRSKYTRSLKEARKDIVEKKSEIEKIDNFAVPIL